MSYGTHTWYGPELITDGGFNNPGAWTNLGGMTISDGSCSINSSTGWGALQVLPDPNVTLGVHKFEADITYFSGELMVHFFGTNNIFPGYFSQHYVGYVDITNILNGNLLIGSFGSAINSRIDNLSLKKVHTASFVTTPTLYGPELVTNGNFSVNSNWSFFGNASIHDGKAWLNTASIYDCFIEQPCNWSYSGHTYLVECDVSGVPLYMDNGGSGPGVLGVGHNSITWTSNYNRQQVYIWGFTTPGVGTIDNLSIKEVIPAGKLGLYQRTGLEIVRDDRNTVAWYDYNDLTTITKTDSSVSRWNDKLGSGHDLIQDVSARQPKWTSNGILFDGVDDFMKTNAFTLIQPETIYIVFRQKSWTVYDAIFDGGIDYSGQLTQDIGGSPGLAMFTISGSQIGNGTGITIDNFGIVICKFNGANSFLQINDNAAQTGTVGNVFIMNGFTLGAYPSLYGFSNIEVKEVIIRKVSDSDNDKNQIYNYLKDKYGL